MAVISGSMMMSCTDFLTIIPPNVIVHENFWQTKDDVNGMLATSYLHLVSSDAVSKAIIWGELRADNLVLNASASNNDLKYIIESNLLDENNYAKWGIYYKAINNANLVIKYAHLVPERDPDFSSGDLEVALGEMYAMRALCHFYLLRTFRDIPLAMVPADNDADLPDYDQVHPLVALDSIMADLDRAESRVMASGGSSNKANNYGRITKNAVLAMKADVSLWRAAFATHYLKSGETELVNNNDIQSYYTECIDACDKVLVNMDKEYDEEYRDKEVLYDNPYCLLQNEVEEIKNVKENKTNTVYEDIFGKKNSLESIFELQVEGKNVENGYCSGIYSLYGSNGNSGTLIVSNLLGSKYADTDLRYYSYTNVGVKTGEDKKGDLIVAKYVASNSDGKKKTWRKSDNFDANWIVYRKTDVMLMKAEALVAQSSVTDADVEEAFNIVDAINKRSKVDPNDAAGNLEKPTGASTMLEMVLDERLRELTFEGKRWYDLVRRALRDNSTDNITFVTGKLDNANAVKTRLSSIDALFFPIHIDELRFNSNLEQNPVWDNDDSSVEMN